MIKHILFIVENHSVPFDRRVWSEALAAREWGYEVSIICPRTRENSGPYEIINGIEIHRFPQFEAKNKIGYLMEYFNALFFQLMMSIRIFRKKRFHIIHGANPPDNIFLIALVFRLFKVRYVFDHHDLCTELYKVKFGRTDSFFRLLALSEAISLKSADLIITTNESYRHIDTAILNGKKNTKPVLVVRNGPDTEKIKVKHPKRNYRDGFEYLVGYVGTISKQEGIDILLRIVHRIIHEAGRRDIKFIVIGSGTHLDDYIKLSEKMNLTEYIEFAGYIPYNELIGILHQCDIGINPEYTNSYTDKSTMMKIMDYMLTGKPVIQFETTEGRNTAGKASIYIQQNNEEQFAYQIVELLENPARRKVMGEYGRTRIERKLAWRLQKENLKKAYEYLERLQ